MPSTDDQQDSLVLPLGDALQVGEDSQVAFVPGGLRIHARVLVPHTGLEAADEIDAVAGEDSVLGVQVQQELPQRRAHLELVLVAADPLEAVAPLGAHDLTLAVLLGVFVRTDPWLVVEIE